MSRRALITGIRGQDGSYLAEHLRAQGYEVFGTSRRAPPNTAADRILAWDGRCADTFRSVLERTAPHEIYNLAGITSGACMFEDAVAIGEANGLAVALMLEAVRRHAPAVRFVQASSREVFGTPTASPQNEDTPRRPRNPYGAAKLYADAMVAIHRDRHGLHAGSAILYNHESERRPPGFVTRKVTLAAARIHAGLQDTLILDSLDARRDWGFAGDVVRGLHAMAQAPSPQDFVFATGVAHSVRELCEIAFARLGLDWRDHVTISAHDPRPAEPAELVGDATRARRELGWAPRVSFREMIETMVDADVRRLQEDAAP